MATYGYAESEAEQSTTSTTYVDACTLTFDADEGDYIVIATLELGNADTGTDSYAQLLIEGTSYGETLQNPFGNAASRYSMGWIKKVTFTEGSKTIKVQFKTENLAYAAKIRNIHIFAWKINMEYNEAEAENDLTTAEEDLVSKTFTPSSQQDYLIIGSVEGKPYSTSYSIILRLKVDDVEKNRIDSEASSSIIYRAHAVMLVQNLDATSHTIKLTGQAESGTMYARRARIVAIPLGSLTKYNAGDETQTSTTSTDYVDKLSLTQTTSAGDHIILSSSEVKMVSTSIAKYNNLLIDGTQYHEEKEVAKDGTDYVNCFFMKKLNLTAASHTFKIQYKTDSSAAACYKKNARIIVIELVVGAVTYTKTWTTDSLFKKLGIPKTAAVDAAFKKPDITKTFALDSAFSKTTQIQKQVDALFKKLDILKTFGIDTDFLKKDILKTFAIDARFGAVVTYTISKQIDVLFKKIDISKTANVDTLFKKKDIQLQKQVDVLFKKLDILKTFGVDVDFLKKDIVKTFAIDARFGAIVTYTISKQIDALFKKLGITKTFGVDVDFEKTLTVQRQIDVMFKKSIALSKQVDVLFKKLSITKLISLDSAFKKLGITKSFGIDADFEKALIIQRQIDVLFKKVGISKIFVLDVVIGQVAPWKGLFGELQILQPTGDMSVISPIATIEIKHPTGEMEIIKR